MKKVFAILLCVLMCFGLLGCGDTTAKVDEEKEYSGSIPLGGNLGDLSLDGPSYGTYKEIEPDELFVYEDTETHVYYDENSVNPYIMTYRWNKDGETLEEVTKYESESNSTGYYQMEEDSGWSSLAGKPCGYICTNTTYKDNYYYVDMVIVEDGEDFLEVVVWSGTEEVVLGDSGKAIWVPKGYTDVLNADERAHGTLFMGEYDEENHLPSIWVGIPGHSYEYFKWFWTETEEEEAPFTEEEYIEFNSSEWTEDKSADFYKAMGTEVVYTANLENDGVKATLYSLDSKEWGLKNTDIWLFAGDKIYQIWTETDIQDATPYIGSTLINSIHDTDEKVFVNGIPLGGNLGSFPIEGECYGVYKEVDFNEVSDYELANNEEAHAYVNLNCDTPFICTFRWDCEGQSLKEAAQEIADEYGNGEYIYYGVLSEEYDCEEAAYLCASYSKNDEFYYCDTYIIKDGDEFVEIDWYAKTEEVEVGDTGVYVWVPTGYSDMLTAEDKENGLFIAAMYDDTYDLPLIGGLKGNKTYEQFKYLWSEDENFHMTEDEFNSFMEVTEWNDEINKKFYDSLNMSIIFSRTEKVNGYNYDVTACMLGDGITRVDDIYLYINGSPYEFWLEYPEGHTEYIADILMNSLHTK